MRLFRERWICRAALAVCVVAAVGLRLGNGAEEPGEFRPQPIASPDTTGVGATGAPHQDPATLPQPKTPPSTIQRKPKQATKTVVLPRQANQWVLNTGWGLIEAPRG